eukprot:4668237-Amphidinium_carterae.1
MLSCSVVVPGGSASFLVQTAPQALRLFLGTALLVAMGEVVQPDTVERPADTLVSGHTAT